MEVINHFLDESVGILKLTMPQAIMLFVSLLLFYLSIVKKCEPLLLLPLAFGMMIANLPVAGLAADSAPLPGSEEPGGLLYYLYQGMHLGIFPPMVFLCIGAITDFGPLIARPSSMIIGLGAQFGIFISLGLAWVLGPLFGGLIPGFEGFTIKQAATIGIIGSADGPTTIYTAIRLAPEKLGVVAVAAYSYMALVPIIQPPIMRLLTTAKERVIVMPPAKQVTKTQKIIFPIGMTLVTLLLVPQAGPLMAMLMLGNLIKESGVVDRYIETLRGPFLNIITIMIGLTVGSTATAAKTIQAETLLIICLGLVAFSFGTAGGIMAAKILNVVTGGKVNPLIGNSGVSAMPMAARVSQKLGQEYNPQNHLVMHAMGPLLAGTIGSALVAGIFIALWRS